MGNQPMGFSALFGVLAVIISQPLLSSAPCGLIGSNPVIVEGRSLLKLSDVQGCEGVAYEVIPSVMIEGEPAVRLVPKASGACRFSKAGSVIVDGKQVRGVGDIACQ